MEKETSVILTVIVLILPVVREKEMEIGSVYEIDPLWIAADQTDGKNVCRENTGKVFSEEVSLKEVKKYGKDNTLFTSSGRSAIALALRSLQEENEQIHKKCLMPAYMCDSVFIPFLQNEWRLCFYHVDRNLKADPEELISLMEKEKPGMLFIHAYYGADTWKELRPLLSEYQKKGLLVMEDVTQSYYLKTDTGADYIVGSLRKWYAIPDGGFVTTDHILHPEYRKKDEYVAKRRLKMLTDKWDYLQKRNLLAPNETEEIEKLQEEKNIYLSLNRQLETYLDQEDTIPYLSDVSRRLLTAVDENACRKKRDANYRFLQEGLQKCRNVATVFGMNVEVTAPLYLPVYIKDREIWQKYLREKDIYVPVLWPLGEENKNELTQDEEYIFDHIAAIPIDQRYGIEEMQRILTVIRMQENGI